MSRISARFAELKRASRAGFVAFITAGDPDFETSCDLMAALPASGADVIELGMPFTDPMADGPAVQAASLRALKGGHTMDRTFEMVRRFRQADAGTPVVLMGYYNPVYARGTSRFCRDAAAAGVDGLILVDLPPEEDLELREPATKEGLALVRLVAPTTGKDRLPGLLRHADGFVYFVSITGVTGSKTIDTSRLVQALKPLRTATSLPLAVGFGIKSEVDAAAVAKVADAVVVGSALVSEIGRFSGPEGKVSPEAPKAVLHLARRLAAAVHSARG